MFKKMPGVVIVYAFENASPAGRVVSSLVATLVCEHNK